LHFHFGVVIDCLTSRKSSVCLIAIELEAMSADTARTDDPIDSDDGGLRNAPTRPSLSREEIQELLAQRNDIPLRHFVASVLLIFAVPVAIMIYPSVVTAILGVLLNIHTFNCFGQLVHGTDHAGIFTSKRWDTRVGHIASAFLGYTRDGHDATHQRHHHFLNTERDGDRVWCEPEAPVSSIFRGWLRDFLFVSASYRFLQYSTGSATDAPVGNEQESGQMLARFFRRKVFVALAPAVAIQLVVIAAYAATAGVQYYFLIYVLPILTLYPAQIRLRSVAEHSFPPGEDGSRPGFDRRVTRSTKGSALLRFVIAPIYYDHHFEHHTLPDMPYYNAPKLRRLLEKRGFAVPYSPGYAAFLWRKWRAERALGEARTSTA
jgi:fatty acid desaturase